MQLLTDKARETKIFEIPLMVSSASLRIVKGVAREQKDAMGNITRKARPYRFVVLSNGRGDELSIPVPQEDIDSLEAMGVTVQDNTPPAS